QHAQQRLVQACSETQPDLGEEQRLSADQDDSKPEGEVEQADREADRELVEADRDPERKQNENLPTCELGDPLASVSFFVNEHPESEQGEHADRDVVGGAADEMAERVTEE